MTPISTATNKAGKAIKGLTGPIAITPNGTTAYVANGGSDTVTPISTATNKARKAIKVGKGPYDRVRSPRTGRPSTPSTTPSAAR